LKHDLPELTLRYDWIIEVLQDMKTFSDRHGMVALARKVDETIRVAEAEIAVAASNRPDDLDDEDPDKLPPRRAAGGARGSRRNTPR
jgi:hypothetical protein